MLTGAHLKSDEFESLAETLRESNTQLKEIVSASQAREEELQSALSALSVVETLQLIVPPEGDLTELNDLRERHEAQMEALRERMTMQREEYERKLAHARSIEAHLRMLAT